MDHHMANNENDTGTNVESFMQDLDAGIFERKFSLALSQVAAATCDNGRQGEVSLKFTFKQIPGTNQVQCSHQIKFSRPTTAGTASEEETRTTPMYVGKYGKLTLAPENQTSFLTREGQVKN